MTALHEAARTLTDEQVREWKEKARQHATTTKGSSTLWTTTEFSLEAYEREFARLARADAFEMAAKMAAPAGRRPCSCTSCSCGNQSDAQAVAAWDACQWTADGIRALAAAEKDQS